MREKLRKLNIQFTGTSKREGRSRQMIKNTPEAKSPEPRDASLKPETVQLTPSIREKKV